jgi:hypothetical protein
MALSLEDAARLMLEFRTIAGVNGVYSILLISTFLGDSIYIVFMQGKIKRVGCISQRTNAANGNFSMDTLLAVGKQQVIFLVYN